jgi:predicted ATP-binding protein involved in virulence
MVSGVGEVHDVPDIAWARSREEGKKGTSRRGLSRLLALARNPPGGRNQHDLPLLAKFGVDSLDRHSGPTVAADGEERYWALAFARADSHYDRGRGYEGCFESHDAWPELLGWIRIQSLADLERGRTLPALAGVLATVKAALGGDGHVRHLWYSVPRRGLMMQLPDGQVLYVDDLSHGYRRIIGIAAELAWRSCILNPRNQAQAPTKAKGVVLIDEIDLHLHPSWQRRVLADLQRAFPLVQFIVATHSPLIVSEAPRECLRLLRLDGTLGSVPHTFGRNADALLEDLQGVPSRPTWAEERLRALAQSVDGGRFEQARTIVGELERHLGSSDPDLVRLATALELEASLAALPEEA